MRIEVEVPERFLLDTLPEELAAQLKLAGALLSFREGRLSAGAACEFAGVDRYTFVQACRRHSIPIVSYDETELDAELETLRSY